MRYTDEMNHFNDSRVAAGRRRKLDFDEERMVLTVPTWDAESGEENEEGVEVPAEYRVCDLCRGKGTHVNPSVDCGGLSSDDFREDPDFAEDYFRGTYDVTCNECHGRRVVPVPVANSDEAREALEALAEMNRADYEYERECAYERAMGC